MRENRDQRGELGQFPFRFMGPTVVKRYLAKTCSAHREEINPSPFPPVPIPPPLEEVDDLVKDTLVMN